MIHGPDDVRHPRAKSARDYFLGVSIFSMLASWAALEIGAAGVSVTAFVIGAIALVIGCSIKTWRKHQGRAGIYR